MPIPELVRFREKYPQYNDLDDMTIADKLAEKYPDAYGDLLLKVESTGQDLTQKPQGFQQRAMTAQPGVEQQIQQRGTPWQSVYEEAQTPFEFKKHPIKRGLLKPAVMGAKVASAGAQTALSIPAVIALELQQGKLKTIPNKIKQAVMGKRVPEMADVAKRAGMPLPKVIGFLWEGLMMDGATKVVRNYKAIQAKYGRDIGKKMIQVGSGGAHEQAVDYGMNKGWNRIFQKRFARSSAEIIPDTVAKRAADGLDEAYKGLQTKYGRTLDSVREGNSSIAEPLGRLSARIQSLRISPKLTSKQNQMVKHFDDLTAQIESGSLNPEKIPIGALQTYKQALKKMIRKTVVERRARPTPDERLILDYIDDINYQISRTASDMGKMNKEYANFMNLYKQTRPQLDQKIGETTQITGKVFRDFFRKDPVTKQAFIEAEKIVSPRFKYMDDILDWNTNKEFMTVWENAGMRESLHPASLLGSGARAGTRQFLKYKTATPTRAMGTPVSMAREAAPYTIPPYLLRGITRRQGE